MAGADIALIRGSFRHGERLLVPAYQLMNSPRSNLLADGSQQCRDALPCRGAVE
jgi:hypothetical protein